MPERAPILGSNMIPRKGTAALQPIEDALEPDIASIPIPAAPPSPPPVLVMPPSAPTIKQDVSPVPRREIPPAPARVLRQPLSYRPPVDIHDWLKDKSHRTGRSIQYLIDEALMRLREDDP